jgi:hypothetical protein
MRIAVQVSDNSELPTKRAGLARPPRRTVIFNRKPIASRTLKTVLKFGPIGPPEKLDKGSVFQFQIFSQCLTCYADGWRRQWLPNPDDVRRLKCMIDVIRNLAAARLGAARQF